MKLTMNQMQQQALFAIQHKKCKHRVSLSIYNTTDKGVPLSIYFYENGGEERCESFNVYRVDDVETFNNAIRVINGEIDPFEEKNA